MSSLAARRSARRPALHAKLHQMMLPLSPLVQYDTGRTHPAFPRSILQFLLLTDDQLESLASFYHQRTPNELHHCYPCPISWPSSGLTIEDKRRKFGRFIGLRGCETPRLVDGRTAAADAMLGCAGNCQLPWDLPLDSPHMCYECAMRQVRQILGSSASDGKDGGMSAGQTPSLPIRRRNQSRRTSSRTRPLRDDKPRRPATYALRLKQMSAPPASAPSSPRVAASPAWSPVPAITVDEIYERARRARLAADADDALLRRKVGHH